MVSLDTDDVTDHRHKPRKRTLTPHLTVRAAVEASGLTHREIAARMGVTEKTVSRWANGHSAVDAWAFPSMLDALGLPRDWQPPPPPDDTKPDD